MANEKNIRDSLIKAGLTPAGAAGLMGNLYAESGLISNRVEVLCLKRLKEAGKIYTDATYTAFVDDGTITRTEFIHPLPGRQYGYGLAQWTTPTRKGKLYDFAKSAKKSIGDEAMQVEFLLKELKADFPAVYKTLTTTANVKTASNAVLKKYEQPADTGTAVQELRYKYSLKYYQEPGITAEDALKTARQWIGCNEADGSHRKIIDLYNGHTPLARGYKVRYTDAWCDTFVSAVFIRLGATDAIGGTECGVAEHVAKFKKAGIWKGRIKPKPGDIIVFDWQQDGLQDHIGFVETMTGNSVVTIEGNYKDAVGRRTIAYNDSQIAGYARPKYSETASGQGESKKEESGEKPSREPKWVGRVTATCLNVRTWAGTSYPTLKSYPQLYKDNLVDVCDTIKADNGSSWHFIRIAGSVYGFVSAKYITKA